MIQISNPNLKISERRGNELWRRKGQTETSKHGEDKGKSNSGEKKTLNSIQIPAVGNGWLFRSAVGKMRRITVAQDLEKIFIKECKRKVKPWNGDQAKDERLVWIACYGMPLNAWNMPAFRSIGSIWGHFLEVDEETLKEVSFDKGKVLIATENTSKISDKIQFIVDG
ncbi:hypothetical protein RHMOL_Rhmol01G0231200 [Rhododendron molle]|uniref:Uncharacterized protein n=1 Tax=Rhododendron molle TaxID=49168 RepID=A0ACC0Q645_RHOML|nr:hypothetical protein RHMOL_Rhmol01G0231200 [Rhododendron molle]